VLFESSDVNNNKNKPKISNWAHINAPAPNFAAENQLRNQCQKKQAKRPLGAIRKRKDSQAIKQSPGKDAEIRKKRKDCQELRIKRTWGLQTQKVNSERSSLMHGALNSKLNLQRSSMTGLMRRIWRFATDKVKSKCAFHADYRILPHWPRLVSSPNSGIIYDPLFPVIHAL